MESLRNQCPSQANERVVLDVGFLERYALLRQSFAKIGRYGRELQNHIKGPVEEKTEVFTFSE
jgi:hypothetical protein